MSLRGGRRQQGCQLTTTTESDSNCNTYLVVVVVWILAQDDNLDTAQWCQQEGTKDILRWWEDLLAVGVLGDKGLSNDLGANEAVLVQPNQAKPRPHLRLAFSLDKAGKLLKVGQLNVPL